MMLYDRNIVETHVGSTKRAMIYTLQVENNGSTKRAMIYTLQVENNGSTQKAMIYTLQVENKTTYVLRC